MHSTHNVGTLQLSGVAKASLTALAALIKPVFYSARMPAMKSNHALRPVQ